MNSTFLCLACPTWLCILISVTGCSTEQTVLRCASGPNPSGTGCASAGQTDGATDGTAGTDSTTDSNNLSGLADVTSGGTFVDDIVASENNDIAAAESKEHTNMLVRDIRNLKEEVAEKLSRRIRVKF